MANGRTTRRRYYRRSYSNFGNRDTMQRSTTNNVARRSSNYDRGASNNATMSISARDVAELINQVTNLVRTVNNMVESMQAMIELIKEMVKKEKADKSEG